MKKLFTTLMCTAAIALTGCSSKVKAADTQKKMEKQGYTVTIYNSDQAKLAYATFNFNVEFEETLYAKKDKDMLFAVYCKNKADAESFVKENIALLSAAGELVIEDPKVGNYNNVAYVGSETSIGYAGLKV